MTGATAATGVIPESVDESLQVETVAGHAEADTPVLPSIGMFLSKTCTIPLIRCDFKQIKKTVKQQTLQDKGETVTSDRTQEETGLPTLARTQLLLVFQPKEIANLKFVLQQENEQS